GAGRGRGPGPGRGRRSRRMAPRGSESGRSAAEAPAATAAVETAPWRPLSFAASLFVPLPPPLPRVRISPRRSLFPAAEHSKTGKISGTTSPLHSIVWSHRCRNAAETLQGHLGAEREGARTYLCRPHEAGLGGGSKPMRRGEASRWRCRSVLS